MFKTRTGIKIVTKAVTAGNFSIVGADLNGGSHFLISHGRALDINGLVIAPYFGDLMMRQGWAAINNVNERKLKYLDPYLADPAAPMDDSLLIAASATLSALEVTGITSPIHEIECVIILYA